MRSFPIKVFSSAVLVATRTPAVFTLALTMRSAVLAEEPVDGSPPPTYSRLLVMAERFLDAVEPSALRQTAIRA
jgi:hypothetical protein